MAFVTQRERVRKKKGERKTSTETFVKTADAQNTTIHRHEKKGPRSTPAMT